MFRRYHEAVFERFWRRDLDIESVPAIAAVLDEAGASGFAAWADQGRAEVTKIVLDAEAQGVFGVPSFIVNNELFWGREHLSDIRAMLT
jgi:2-hydroxychromene-2-carboxylate isomerase